MLSLLVLGTAALGLLLAYLALLQPYFRYRNLPPGPWPWPPFLGNYSGHNKTIVFLRVLRDFVPRFGPVLTLWWGRTPIIFVNDLNITMELFGQENGRSVAGRKPSYLDTIVSENNHDMFSNNYGPVWRELTRVMKDAVSKCALRGPIEDQTSCSIDMFCENFIQQPDNGGPGFYPFDEAYWLSDNIVLGTFIGRVYEQNDEEYQTLFQSRKDVFEVLDNADFANWIPLAHHLPIPSVLKVKRQAQRLNELLAKFVQTVKEQGNYMHDPIYVIEHMLRSIYEQSNSPNREAKLNEVHVRQVFKDVLFASYEGIGLTNIWFLGILALHPEIQQRIREEVTAVSNKLGDKTPRLSWRPELPYVQAVEFEFFRYSAIVGILDFHYSLATVKVGKYTIPKDCFVAINQFALNHDPVRFPDPELVRPERFLDEKGQFAERKDVMPFGYGVRMCPGQPMTKAYAFLLLCNLCLRYKIEWSDSNETDSIVLDELESGLFRFPQKFLLKMSKV